MCNGRGQVRSQQGFFSVQQGCPQCRGKGTIISDPCKPCRGAGRVQKNKSLMVNIPKGVDEGSRIRLTGEGEAGINGGQQGDLYIFVSVKRHNLFIREDDNLFSEVPVSVIDATIGGTIDVPTIDGGKARLKIPAGTQSGDQFRLKSKGMPSVRGGKVGISEASGGKGYRIISNAGSDAHQTVDHFHVHLLAGRNLGPMLVSIE